MGDILLVVFAIIALIFCCAFPYYYSQDYVRKYGEKGISYLTAAISGASVLWLSLVYESKESTSYSIAMILVIISVVLNIYKIWKECRRAEVTIGDKIIISVCQILFAAGIFGLLVIGLMILYFAGGGGKRKKR